MSSASTIVLLALIVAATVQIAAFFAISDERPIASRRVQPK